MVKKLLVGCSVLLLALLITICAIPVLIDANNYKTDMASLIKDKTGRDVAFGGDISVSLFPWVGLSAEKMVISNPPSFQELPFITVDKSDITVKLLPLLMQKFEISTIALEGLTLNLAKDKQGASNWGDLIETKPMSPPSAAMVNPDGQVGAKSALAALTVGSVNIQNARVNWDNQQTGERLELKNIRFMADKFVIGETARIDMAMDVSGKEFKFPGSIKWVTDLRVDGKLDGIVFNDSHIEWVGSNKSGSGLPLAATMTVPSADVNITQQALQLSGLQLQSGDIKVTADMRGDDILDKPSIQGSVAIAPFNASVTMKQWGVALPAMRYAKALTDFSMKLQLQATSDSAEFSGLDILLDNTRGTGSVTIKGFAQPSLLFDLAVDTLDVDRYLAPQEKPTIASPGMAFAAGTFSLPLEWLRKLDAEGKLALGKLTVNRMALQDLRLTLSSKKGIVKIGQTANQFYQGTYSGDLSVDARAEKSSLALKEKLTHIRLEPLLKDVKGGAKMGGIVTASSQLHGQGNNSRELNSNLTGQLDFLIKDGYVKGFNLEKMVENSKNLVKGGGLSIDAQHDQTAFSEISGTATISKGWLQNNDLIAKTAKLRSTGKGNANLDTGFVDYQITTKLLKAAATATTPEQVHDTPIVIHVGGTFSKPIYTLDMAALLTDKNKAKIEHFLDKNKVKLDKLMDKLDKKLGPGTSDLLKKIF
jgi:AsmA protein